MSPNELQILLAKIGFLIFVTYALCFSRMQALIFF